MIRKLWHRLFGNRKAPPGQRGEKIAADFLKAQGYRILERNLKTPQGELDIVALTADQKTVVFVEVKTSVEIHHYHLPEFRVDHRKQRQIVNLAAHWCRRAKLDDLTIRFDVIGVNLPPEIEPIVRHIPGAFDSHV
ncbi:MAG TPA: YraN family protein [Phycisphaerales bacterium]|nr:YraN family protein [Phycisphaerales bacterium]HCD34825.1 YraN family protein [Phycisphaerales bacterium]|tara:strand:+ start:139 stop:546 length:408 start_codon:yes stop_codon:yes gene_type:complete